MESVALQPSISSGRITSALFIVSKSWLFNVLTGNNMNPQMTEEFAACPVPNQYQSTSSQSEIKVHAVAQCILANVAEFRPQSPLQTLSKCSTIRVQQMEIIHSNWLDFIFYACTVLDGFKSIFTPQFHFLGQKMKGRKISSQGSNNLVYFTINAETPEWCYRCTLFNGEKKKELVTFPYSRFILWCYKFRPSSNLDHHTLYWKALGINEGKHSARIESNTLLECFNKYLDYPLIVKLVLRQLRTHCEYSAVENRYIGSINKLSTLLGETIQSQCINLDFMFRVLDVILVLLKNKRNRKTLENLSKMLLSLTKFFGFCGLNCIQQLNTEVYMQMCQVKELTFQFEFAEKQSKAYLEARFQGLFYLSFSIQAFYKDPEAWPLLSVLASYISGEDACREKFREFGFTQLLSKILKKSHTHTRLSEECYKVLDIASDGNPANVISLLNGNDDLRTEITFAMMNFRKSKSICERMLSILIKLVKANGRESQWLEDANVLGFTSSISANHPTTPALDVSSNQLILLLKYSLRTKTTSMHSSPGDIERALRAHIRGREDPKKVRVRAARAKTCVPRSFRSQADGTATAEYKGKKNISSRNMRSTPQDSNVGVSTEVSSSCARHQNNTPSRQRPDSRRSRKKEDEKEVPK